MRPVLEVRDLWLDAPGGRPLLRELNLSFGRERAAVIGRNGVGKSSLLQTLAGQLAPRRGRVVCHGERFMVSQELAPRLSEPGLSPGERRRQELERARDLQPELLLLDEPTQDLDRASVDWLLHWLDDWRQGLIVVSHDPRLLATFSDFLVVSESGCRYFSGTLSALCEDQALSDDEQNRKYVRNLERLAQQEHHNAIVSRRRQRKKRQGRNREIGRATPRAVLNSKRSYAQESQGKRAVLQDRRISAARDWTRASRRALAVELPLDVVLPVLPEDDGQPIVCLESVGAEVGGRRLFNQLELHVGRQRLAITGPNGAGKSTLIDIMLGRQRPSSGTAWAASARIGFIAQNAENWCSEDSLLELLQGRSGATSASALARIVVAHRFPLALATRPLNSLSPGERVRAALMCLFQSRPVLELLILDEPTDDLDFVGTPALQKTLSTWGGGLIVVSHDDDFLESVGVDQRLALDGLGGHRTGS